MIQFRCLFLWQILLDVDDMFVGVGREVSARSFTAAPAHADCHASKIIKMQAYTRNRTTNYIKNILLKKKKTAV